MGRRLASELISGVLNSAVWLDIDAIVDPACVAGMVPGPETA